MRECEETTDRTARMWGICHWRLADYWSLIGPGLGFGDVKLLAMIGAFLGPYGVVETILAAALVGLVLGLGWAAVERSWSSPFGFAPAIAIGAIGVLISPVHLLTQSG